MLREYESNKLDYKFRVNGAVYRARTEEEEQSQQQAVRVKKCHVYN